MAADRRVRQLIRARAPVLATLVALASCGGSPDVLPPLTAEVTDSAGTTVLKLSRTLAEVAEGETASRVLEPDLIVGKADDPNGVWFGAVADVSSLGGGAFAVLDNMQDRVALIDSLGRMDGALGREGDGPGEFRNAWAVTRVGRSLIVRQNVETSAFTIFESGRPPTVAPARPEGDWSAPMFRLPTASTWGFQMGPEDITRRLAAFDDSSFIHMLQPNELATYDFLDPIEFRDGTPTYLIRSDRSGHPLDTIAALAGPPTYVQGMWVGSSIFYAQPLFSSRPVWATGDGWYATGHGDSTEVVVKERSGSVLLRVRFPDRRRAVTEGDRTAAADWHISGRLLNVAADMGRLRAEGRALLRRAREGTLSRILMDYADSIPMIMGAYGAGDCLFLSGFGPDDWQDGTSLTWTVIDVRRPALLETVRLRPPSEASLPAYPEYSRSGAVVRDIDGHYAFAYQLMTDGAGVVERFPLPEGCGP